MLIEDFDKLFDSEVANIKQQALLDRIHELRISTRVETRKWDYGKEGERFQCWVCIEDRETQVGIAYCRDGHGHHSPWGVVSLDERYDYIGPDYSWSDSLEDAFRDAIFWDGPNPEDYEVG